MNLQNMINAINRRVDDVVDTADAVEWLNSGKNQMAIAVGAKFPDLDQSAMNDSFVFDDKYHEIPVLYAAASFKEQDSAISEAANYLGQFENLKKEFIKSYVVPPRYRDDRLSQQFVATAGQTDFTVTKNGYDATYGDVKMYVNDVLVLSTGTTLVTPANAGDAVTAIWEEHTDLIDPPYSWWTW